MTSPDKFRAVIENTGEEKAVQFIGVSMALTRDAAKVTLATNAHKWGAAHVAVYRVEETIVETVPAEECVAWYADVLKTGKKKEVEG